VNPRLKHRIKLLARDLYARILWHTGLWRLVDRVVERRLTILAGHCVDDPETNGSLPADMKIRPDRLRAILCTLGRAFDLVTVGEGYARLHEPGRRSMVALSLDDGYRDNATVLPALLEECGARATIFLESRPLDERRVNWSHKWFWLLGRVAPAEAVRRYLVETRDEAAAAKLRALAGGEGLAYRAKLVLKYDAERGERDRTIVRMFEAAGGDERALCDRIYMRWDDARALAARGVELGGHTVTHAILSRLDLPEQETEIRGGRASLERELGPGALRSFAYPFGRRWDWDERSVLAARTSGFELAVTTHPGTNTASSDPYRLARWMIDDSTPIHVLGTEAAGGFALLRRIGIELAE
jgi:peptidoglycan/xylan/chitin deacetylase (PgdA/CDA1 family)